MLVPASDRFHYAPQAAGRCIVTVLVAVLAEYDRFHLLHYAGRCIVTVLVAASYRVL